MSDTTPSLPQAVLTPKEVDDIMWRVIGARAKKRNVPHEAVLTDIRKITSIRDDFVEAIESAILSRMGGEAVQAWRTDDGRVISAEQKATALRDGGASASSVAPFHIALVAAPTAPAQLAALAVACEDCNGAGEVGEPYGGSEFQPPERDRCESCGGSGQQAADVQGEAYPEPIGAFQADQWWLPELEAMARREGTTPDQQRAVAVVRHMLKSAAAQSVPKGGAHERVSAYVKARTGLRGMDTDTIACVNGAEHELLLSDLRTLLAASAPTVGGRLQAQCRELADAIKSDGCCSHWKEAVKLLGTLAAQEPRAAAEPVAVRDDVQAVLDMLDVPVIGYMASHSGKFSKKLETLKLDNFESAVPLVREWDHRRACDKIIAKVPPPPTPPSAPAGADDLPQRLIAAARRDSLTWEDRIAIGNAIARIQAASAPPSHEGPDALDAARYRWLREQHWHTAPMCVVANPKNAVKLGYFCPSDERLDAMIDAARAGGEQ